MNELERQLTAALKRLSAQSETEQRRQSEQVEALRRQVERQDRGERHLEAANRAARRTSDALDRVLRDIRRRETARPRLGDNAAARPRPGPWSKPLIVRGHFRTFRLPPGIRMSRSSGQGTISWAAKTGHAPGRNLDECSGLGFWCVRALRCRSWKVPTRRIRAAS